MTSSNYWPEIDVLRGIAAALMVANHAGVAWLQPDAPAMGVAHTLTFVGSLAPVVFFAATGLGRGVQSAAARQRRSLIPPLKKACVLWLGDAAMWLSAGACFGLDFLGFIALSSLLVELACRSRWPRLSLALGAISALALRFLLAPRLDLPVTEGITNALLHFVLGDAGVTGVSYPLCPWLAFPLCGALIGEFAAASADRLRARRLEWAGVTALLGFLGLGLCVLLQRRGMIFFRWGTLSFAYTVFGFAALLTGLAAALALVARAPASVVVAVSLPGLASLVVVPAHYALVEALGRFVAGAGQAFVLAAMALGVALVFGFSKRLSRSLHVLAGVAVRRGWMPVAGAATLLSVAACAWAARTPFALGAMLFAELLVCAFFSMLGQTARSA